MLIDINTRRPKISNRRGGVSGPAILPITIRCIYDIYKRVSIPIIGMGGINNSEDALQAIMAGATLYGLGTGVIYHGIDIFEKINKGIDTWLSENSLAYDQIIGAAHDE
jgi:dihydroorotate dehydrogenase (NAD+) catalytic subunit